MLRRLLAALSLLALIAQPAYAATPGNGYPLQSPVVGSTVFTCYAAGGTTNTCKASDIANLGPTNTYSATSFAGVDPTGATNSTAGLASALSAAAGAVLNMPAGTYLVSSFNIPANTRIAGAGQGLTVIKRLASEVRSATHSNATSALVQVASGDTVGNLTVDLNSPGYAAPLDISTYNSVSGIGPALNASATGVTVEHVTILNAGFNGLSFDNGGAQTYVGLRIDDVTINGSAWAGALLRGVQNGSATRLNVFTSGWNAVDLEGDTNFVLSNFRIDKSVSPAALPLEVNNSTTSATNSVAITNTGSITLAVASCSNFAAKRAVYAYSTAAPTSYVYGAITSCSGTTMIIAASASSGSGTPAAWTVVGELGMGIFRGVKDQNLVIANGAVNDNRHAVSDGIGLGENGTLVTSSDSVTPGTGAKTFVPIEANACANYPAGQNVSVFSQATPTTKWMRGTVTGCTKSTHTLVINATQAAGASATDWIINTEPGAEIISNVVVAYAGLFGIDVTSNDTVVGAEIDYPASRGLEIGLDAGGRLSNSSASNVRVLDVVSGPGVFFGDGLKFQSFENINLSHITVVDDQATRTTTYGVQVNATSTQQAYSNVTLDNSNSYYSQVLTAPYNEFGTDSVRLDGSLKAFATTATWTGGTPTGYTFGGGACPGATCVIHWDDHGSGKTRYLNIQIAEGAVSGTTGLSITLPFTINAIEGCTISGIDATNNSNALGYAAAGGTSMIIVPTGFTTSHGLALAGSCQIQ